MNDAEGRKTLLCEMNVTEGIEDGNKDQGAILALNQSFMTKVLVCVSTEIESNQEFLHPILTLPLHACCSRLAIVGLVWFGAQTIPNGYYLFGFKARPTDKEILRPNHY